MAPAILLAAVLSNATGDSSVPTAIGIATGNAVAAVTGALLLARAGFEPTLRRVRDVIALAILGAAVSTAVNATIGTATLLAAGVADSVQPVGLLARVVARRPDRRAARRAAAAAPADRATAGARGGATPRGSPRPACWRPRLSR